VAATPSPIPSLTATTTATATLTPIPTQTATATVEATPTEYVQPTLIPTIDPTLVPGLLSKAFSIQTLEGSNGHTLRQITGWDYGFGAGIWQYSCSGYYWLDTNHLLLYPSTGQEYGGPEGMWRVNVAPQPIIINLKTGYVWLPSEEVSAPSWSCSPVYWSKKLELLIISGTYNGKSAIFTYTLEGKRLAYYPGDLSSISPSKTKILVGDNTIIDLQTNKKVTLAWSLEDYHEFTLSGLFWTSDETRIYRCCYFYADLATGISHRFERSDFYLTDGTHLDPDGLWFYRGGWVRNDTYFLGEWSYVDDGDIRYLPMFDPAKKLIYDVREMAGISDELTCPDTNISTDGSYVWLECYDKHYLIDLTTFEADEYSIPGYSNADIDWSTDEKFVLIQNYDHTSEAELYYLVSLSNEELTTLPMVMKLVGDSWPQVRWHPAENVLAYITESTQRFAVFDAQTMTSRDIALPTTFQDLIWSRDGNKLALVAEDGSVWQIDYPKLESLEQLTPPLPDVHDVNWSPDGNSIAFISGSDIYIVDTAKK
jgi:hypothetical protein